MPTRAVYACLARTPRASERHQPKPLDEHRHLPQLPPATDER